MVQTTRRMLSSVPRHEPFMTLTTLASWTCLTRPSFPTWPRTSSRGHRTATPPIVTSASTTAVTASRRRVRRDTAASPAA